MFNGGLLLKILLAFIVRNRLPWTRQSGLDWARTGISSRLLGHGENDTAYEERRRLTNPETYADEPESEIGQASNHEQAASDQQVIGTLGNNSAVRISSLHRQE